MGHIYWADIHNHNEVGYGKGSMERSYKIAKNSLDVYAFTPHGYWPDPPVTDPKLVKSHSQAFDQMRDVFSDVVEKANREYVPGRFVTFPAYEWHTITWGDYVVLFPADKAQLYKAENLAELREFTVMNNAILIPHHVAYRCGWRGLNWDAFDSNISPVVEMFSEHGNSFDTDGLWPMHNHSMGGSTYSQTVLEQLKIGRHFGFTAGTDNHYGYPACYGEGITAIIADSLSREAIFEALRSKHCYAVTGDRIKINLTCDGATMGDTLDVKSKRKLNLSVNSLAPIEFVQIIKNGSPTVSWMPCNAEKKHDKGQYVIRITWGWGRMEHSELTKWLIDISLLDGIIEEVVPCFCGGAGSVDLCNLVSLDSSGRVQIESFTSRLNKYPTNGVVLKISGSVSSQLKCNVSSDCEDGRGQCQLNASLGQLFSDGIWGQVLERFSSPRICIDKAYFSDELHFSKTWEDQDQTESDSYVVRVQQKNGHCAWTSPMLFT